MMKLINLMKLIKKDPVWCGGVTVFVIIIPTPVWVFDLDFDWGVAIEVEIEVKLIFCVILSFSLQFWSILNDCDTM